MFSRNVCCLAMVLSLLGCRATVPDTGCNAREWLATAVVAKRATLDEVKAKYLSIIDIGSVPAAAQPGVVSWIDEEVRRLHEKAQPRDEVWYFREEKCPRCGWYREGYALIRDCMVVDEITLSDDM